MDRYVVEVFVTAVDEQGDELEVITVKSHMLALHDRDKALRVATVASEVARDVTGWVTDVGQVSAQYPSRA